MAITTYATLQTAIQNWAARSDSAFTARLDEFIAGAEDRIAYGSDDPEFPSDPLRVLGTETTADLTISSATVAQPSGWIESIRLYLNTDPKAELTFLPPHRFYEAYASASTTGKPVMYTVEGTNFIFAPTPDQSYTGKISYFIKMTGLSSSNTTNWLITNSPMTYLYACLIEACLWMMDDEGARKYHRLFSSKINALQRQDRRARSSGSFLRAIADDNP